MNQARGGIGRLARWEKTQDGPNNLPYVQAVKRAPVAETAAADAGLGGGSADPIGRSTEESTLTNCATPGLAAKEGAKVSAVQKMLGHSSAKMALDTCTHLFDDELGGVAERFAPPPPGPQAGTGPDSGRVH